MAILRKKYILLYLLGCLCDFVLAQDNILILNRGYIILNGGTSSTPITLMINQTNGQGIVTFSPSAGGLISEGEYNQVKWGIAAATGSYSVPYTTSTSASGIAIPFTVSITVSGSGNGNVLFSTFKTNYLNNPRPSDVTNMTGTYTGADNSLKVVDRFWVVDADGGYSTKPTIGGMVFTYTDKELSGYGGSNTITEANLKAQRFDESSSWDGWGPGGTATAASNFVTSTSVAPAHFFRSWVLVDNSSPLPIELISFQGSCNENKIMLNWSTASETNNDFFTLEKSQDGINFQPFTFIDGAGNSNKILNYTAADFNPYSGTSYYRLMQTDFDGTSRYSDVIAANPCPTINRLDSVANAFSDGTGAITIQISSINENQYDISIYDLMGKRVFTVHEKVSAGQNEFKFDISFLSKSIYMISISNDLSVFTKKVSLD